MLIVNVSTGRKRSLEYTLTYFKTFPLFPAVSTLAFTCPTAPGSR